MPIHEFKCKGCGNVFEYLCIRSGDKEHVLCPSCGHDETEVLLSSFSSKASGRAEGGGKTLSSSCSPFGGFS
jgi:putative FmdB family regulatory protein